jgi:hypothetical protein
MNPPKPQYLNPLQIQRMEREIAVMAAISEAARHSAEQMGRKEFGKVYYRSARALKP